MEFHVKWFTFVEYWRLITTRRLTYSGLDLSKYAEELGDGIRFWVTTLVGVLVLGFLLFVFGVNLLGVFAPIAFAIGCLIVMTLGYLVGGFFSRGFSPHSVLVLAMKNALRR